MAPRRLGFHQPSPEDGTQCAAAGPAGGDWKVCCRMNGYGNGEMSDFIIKMG
jgi:hypothetical protein